MHFCRNVSYNNLAGDISRGNNFSGFSPERLDKLESIVFVSTLNMSSILNKTSYTVVFVNVASKKYNFTVTYICNIVYSFLGNPHICGYWLSSPCYASRSPGRGKHTLCVYRVVIHFLSVYSILGLYNSIMFVDPSSKSSTTPFQIT